MGYARNQRRFGQRKLRRRLAEIGLRSLFGPVRALTKVDQVEVHLQDFLFGVEGCQILGNQHLEDLAVNRLIVAARRGKEEIARKLHGNCACAGDHVARRSVLNESSNHAARVDALVLEERGVFGGDCGVDHVGRNAAEGHPRAPPLVHQFRQHRAVAVADDGVLEDARQRAGLIAAQIGLCHLERRIALARGQLILGIVAR